MKRGIPTISTVSRVVNEAPMIWFKEDRSEWCLEELSARIHFNWITQSWQLKGLKAPIDSTHRFDEVGEL